MGGEISKINAKSKKISPNFLHRRLHDMMKRRRFRRGTKECTPSKKELLAYDAIEEDEKLEGSLEKGDYVIKDMKRVDDQEKVAKIIEAIVQEDEEDENNKDDQRMIRRTTHVEEGGDVCPGSPSFRIYFTDNNNVEEKKINEVKIGNKDVIKDRTSITTTNRPTTPVAATIPSAKVAPEGKKETKRKSFRSVLPKNLLNVRSCCSAARSRPDRNHLLPGKAPA